MIFLAKEAFGLELWGTCLSKKMERKSLETGGQILGLLLWSVESGT